MREFVFILTLIFILFANSISVGQEVALEATAPLSKGDRWIENSKVYWLIAFTLFTILLVIRTFRGKPEA